MAEIGHDERGATSVTGLVALLAVTIILASAVAVFAFGVDTEDVQSAADEILDMDQTLSVLPLVFVPVTGLGRGRESNEASAARWTRLRIGREE